jgi:hypothetical protein
MGGQQSMPKREQTMKGDIARILFAALVAVLAFNISGHASAARTDIHAGAMHAYSPQG